MVWRSQCRRRHVMEDVVGGSGDTKSLDVGTGNRDGRSSENLQDARGGRLVVRGYLFVLFVCTCLVRSMRLRTRKCMLLELRFACNLHGVVRDGEDITVMCMACQLHLQDVVSDFAIHRVFETNSPLRLVVPAVHGRLLSSPVSLRICLSLLLSFLYTTLVILSTSS